MTILHRHLKIIKFIVTFWLSITISQKYNLFVPSYEWKEVLEGEMVPAGDIHVRMDLKSGRKYAKINTDRHGSELVAVKLSDHNITTNNKKYKTIEEIKKDLDDVFGNGQHFIVELLKDMQNASLHISRRIEIINELEDHLHDIDNAGIFVKHGGLEALLSYINLKSTIALYQPILRSLFAVLQNNHFVQMHFSMIGGTDFMALALNRTLLRKGGEKTVRKIASVVSAALRGCSECFHKFSTRKDNFFSALIDLKDNHVKSKIVTMLISAYHESKFSMASLKEDLLHLLKSHSLCDHRKSYLILTDREDSTGNFYGMSLSMYRELCDSSEL